ncbi:MAG: NB-ARC domain-containing protein [Cyanobacteria bacterium J06648_16]
MTFEQTLAILANRYAAAQKKPLSPLEQRILQAAWQQESYATVAQQLYLTEGHVKDVAANLWKALSQILTIKVTKRSLRGVLEQLPLGAASTPTPVSQTAASADWAPDLATFCGRQTELQTLAQWIVDDRCRLVSLLGLGGIGKTALANKLAQQLQPQFEVVIWRSLLNAPPLVDLLRSLVGVLSAAPPQVESLDHLLLELINGLRQRRCLIVLDNVETVLPKAGEQPYREGYADYDGFLRRVGESAHQSCLLLTSREKPPAVARLEGPLKTTRSYPLTGLDTTSACSVVQAACSLQATRDDWHTLVEFYQGHPLAIDLAAKHIDDVFLGDVRAFLQTGKSVFGDIQKLLDEHFNRLTLAEQAVLYWLAVYRRPVSLSQLRQSALTALEKAQLPTALQGLKRQLPLQRDNQGFSLQPVLLEYVTDRLIERITDALIHGDLKTLDSIGLLQTTAPYAVQQTQKRVLLEPILSQCQGAIAPNETVAPLLHEWLHKLQALALTGYVGGNLFNLLIASDTPLTGADFSGLTLRQINLQGCELRQTCFAAAHFDSLALTQAISGVLAVAQNSEASLIAASDSDGRVLLYDRGTDWPRLTLDGHAPQTWVYGLALSPAGTIVLSGGVDGKLRQWCTQTGQPLGRWQLDSEVLAIAYHPDGERFASAGTDGKILCWQSGQIVSVLTGHGNPVWALDFGPDGTWLVSGDAQGQLCRWDLPSGQLRYRRQSHTGRLQSLSVSPDGQWIATSGGDRTIKCWQASDGALAATLTSSQMVRSVAFHSSGQQLASAGNNGTIQLWEVATGRVVKTLREPQGHRLDRIAFGDCGDTLVVGAKDQVLQVWDMATGGCLQSLQGFTCGTTALAFTPDGQRLVSSGLDNSVWVWDLAAGRVLHQLKGHRSTVWAATVSSDGQTLASGSYDGSVRLWDIPSGKLQQVCWGHQNFVKSLAFSPVDPHRLVSASLDGTIRVWNSQTGRCEQTLSSAQPEVVQVRFTPDGQRLVSSGNDGRVYCWEIPSDPQSKWRAQLAIEAADRVVAIALHPHAPLLVTSSGQGYLELWHLETGERLARWQGHRGRVWSVAFSPDGSQVVSGSRDRTLRLWAVATGECLHCWPQAAPVGAVAFNPSGDHLVCGTLAAPICIYDAQTLAPSHTLQIPQPYEGMDIRGATGLSSGQRSTLLALGARL